MFANMNPLRKVYFFVSFSLVMVSIYAQLTSKPLFRQKRITNGRNAFAKDYPGNILITYDDHNEPEGFSRCGGILVTVQHALTIGTCVHKKTGIKIYAGMDNFAKASTDKDVQKFTVLNITYPAGFLEDDSHNIALIMLDRYITPTRKVFPFNAIRDVFTEETYYDIVYDYSNVLCMVCGFGKVCNGVLEVDGYSNQLQETLVNMFVCKKEPITEYVCTRSVNGRTIYKGDIGAPLICDGKWLVGLALSYNNFHCSAPYEELETTYIRLDNFGDWVKNNSQTPGFVEYYKEKEQGHA